jgi:hypothetical protein
MQPTDPSQPNREAFLALIQLMIGANTKRLVRYVHNSTSLANALHATRPTTAANTLARRYRVDDFTGQLPAVVLTVKYALSHMDSGYIHVEAPDPSMPPTLQQHMMLSSSANG